MYAYISMEIQNRSELIDKGNCRFCYPFVTNGHKKTIESIDNQWFLFSNKYRGRESNPHDI